MLYRNSAFTQQHICLYFSSFCLFWGTVVFKPIISTIIVLWLVSIITTVFSYFPICLRLKDARNVIKSCKPSAGHAEYIKHTHTHTLLHWSSIYNVKSHQSQHTHLWLHMVNSIIQYWSCISTCSNASRTLTFRIMFNFLICFLCVFFFVFFNRFCLFNSSARCYFFSFLMLNRCACSPSEDVHICQSLKCWYEFALWDCF